MSFDLGVHEPVPLYQLLRQEGWASVMEVGALQDQQALALSDDRVVAQLAQWFIKLKLIQQLPTG